MARKLKKPLYFRKLEAIGYYKELAENLLKLIEEVEAEMVAAHRARQLKKAKCPRKAKKRYH